jgi:CubicO group peptidase (beta-lactamase class C family)
MRRFGVLALALLLLGAAPHLDDQQAMTDAIFRNLVAPDEPGLAVLVRRNGRTVLARGYGLRDPRTRVPIDARTSFRLASVTKQLTATAIMLLVRDGRLRYDDALPDVLPGFPAYGRAVTIRHLLTHTSGLRDYEQLMETADKASGPRWSADRQIRDEESWPFSSGRARTGSHPGAGGPTATPATSCWASWRRAPRAGPSASSCASGSSRRSA